jgi:acyl-CoA thioesterase-1
MSYRNPFHRAFALCCFIALSGLTGSPLASPATPEKTILIVGDSISAAYGMSLEEGWVALLARQLEESHPDYSVINASISGETSAGAAARLPRLLEHHRPRVVVIELGGNDGLRGYPVKRLRENLRNMVELSAAADARVLLLGMEIPPNYGARYTAQFRESFALVAGETDSDLVHFMLDGIATDPKLMQADGIHPTRAAQVMLLANVWPQLEAMLAN